MGLFYTLLSHVTTLGNPHDKFLSAIYFTGTNMKTGRVLNITQNEKGNMFIMAQRRQIHVAHLQQHKHDGQMNTNIQTKILEWTKTKMNA